MNSYNQKGPEFDIAVSSRVRLARNFNDIPFPIKMSQDQQNKLIERMQHIFSNVPNQKLAYLNMPSLHEIEKYSLVERHLISPDLAETRNNSGAFINENQNISIMINEEDHIRIQTLYNGIQLERAYEECNAIDGIIEKEADYAFDIRYGYLTSCPTNLGTGIRASVMLHLPALVMTGYIKSVLENCSKIGVAVRGLYGENSDALGDMFQVSNQITLGRKEEEIISSIDNISKQIIDREKALRHQLYKQDVYRFEDRIFRSYGILKNARIINSEECFKLISDVRLGVSMGIINGVDIVDINDIMVFSQPATLQKIMGKQLSKDERDIKRAELIRQKMLK